MKPLMILAVTLLVSGSEAYAEAPTPYVINEDNYSIDQPLTNTPGDINNGQRVFIDRKKGNCLACHGVIQLEDTEQFHGEVGPELSTIGADYTLEELRLRVADARFINPLGIMPAFLKSEGHFRPIDKFADTPILTAQEVEDVIAYLTTLR